MLFERRYYAKFGIITLFSSPEPNGSQDAPLVYPSSRRPSVRPSFVHPSVVVHNIKHLLLQNHWASHSQILCGASMDWGNKSLFAASGSHDQDGRQAHLWQKLFKNLLRNQWTDFNETWFVASRTPAHYGSCK